MSQQQRVVARAMRKGLPAVVRLLQHSGDAAVQAIAAVTLWAQAANGKSDDVVAAGTIRVCIGLIATPGCSQVVQRESARLLTQLMRAHTSYAQASTMLGAPAALGGCLARSRCPRMQLALLQALRALAFKSPDRARAVVSAGVLPALLARFHRSPASAIRHTALELLRMCAEHSPAGCRVLAADARALPTLVHALSTLSADRGMPAAVEQGVRTLAAIAGSCPASLDRLANARLLPSLLTLLWHTTYAGGPDAASSAGGSGSHNGSGGDSQSASGSSSGSDSDDDDHVIDDPAIVRAQASSTALLCGIARRSAANRRALAAAGGIPLLVELASWRNFSLYRVLGQLAADDAACHPAIEAAGGIRDLVLHVGWSIERCHDQVEQPSRALAALAKGGPASCQAVHAAGGVAALARVLAAGKPPPPQNDTAPAERKAAAEALAWLAACGGADVADAVQAHTAALPADGARLLAAATSAVAAVRARDTPQPAPGPSTPGKRSPRRTCAAPGCSGSRGLYRCGGCGTVWYCGEPCRNLHWRQHRADCRRLQAEQAAKAGQP